MKIKSPAKINLMLKIKGKRKDGYHLIESIMVPISLFDEINIEKSNKFEITMSNFSEKLSIEKNIVFKTFKAVEKYINTTLPSFKINILKNIPSGAGLGGGSGNGAIFLEFLDNFFNLGLKFQEKIKIASSIGADLPFFLYKKPAFVEGIGEILNPLKIQDFPFDLLLIKPPISISSKEAYEIFDKKKLTNDIQININNDRRFRSCSFDNWETVLYNSLEEPVTSVYKELKQIRSELKTMNADYVFMTGSGSTMVGVFSNSKTLKNAKSFFENKKDYTVKEVRLLL
jgi:4-diphosphocytidyl-2-C-methyl-D-erythritol kinase